MTFFQALGQGTHEDPRDVRLVGLDQWDGVQWDHKVPWKVGSMTLRKGSWWLLSTSLTHRAVGCDCQGGRGEGPGEDGGQVGASRQPSSGHRTQGWHSGFWLLPCLPF